MQDETTFDVFLVCIPGLEPFLQAEAAEAGFKAPKVVNGGVEFRGGWSEVWRANLELRIATRVLVRIGRFMAFHLAQLDKRARKFPFGQLLAPEVPVSVQVTCKSSRIYHAKAAEQRIARALHESHGITVSNNAGVALKVRIDDNAVEISIDTSGAPLHRREIKNAVGKAPLRESIAAACLRACGFDGSQTVVDPMCGSGTFPIEAAEISNGLQAGRARAFAFQHLLSFDVATFAALRRDPQSSEVRRFLGSDRDQGVIQGAVSNAARAGVEACCQFNRHALSDLQRPDGPPGLVMVNPPYGARIGNRRALFALYASFGSVMTERFAGWRVGLITSDAGLARSTGLSWESKGAPIAHGGTKVWLWQAQL